LHQFLSKSLNDDLSHDWIIKKGFDAQLDQVRDLVDHAQIKIIELERREQANTGINSLKVRYHQSHGYFIEITKTHLHAVPSHYVRKQSLVGKERFITDELHTLQYDIERAREQIAALEKELFEHVKRVVAQRISALRKCAYALAHLDALVGFARVAYDNGYIRPLVQKGKQQNIMIEQGRHPVVEQSVGSRFIANDTALTDNQSLWIITGPNMGGKSTYLRQVALMTIMAQCGSFIPAQAARLPILDRIFTRIGAGDNVAEGKSTFLVEMEETATICKEATRNSLVILDEVGRGTSTFDGLAIAQAVVEYMYTRIGARCLFATHYHELTALAEQFPGIVNYHAASKKTAGGIVLLHKIIQGVADGSFGIEVARLAELPPVVIERAITIVSELSEGQKPVLPAAQAPLREEQKVQPALKDEHEELFKILCEINYEELSPKKAFDLLWRVKEQL
jgi:DNA mismatch repair protein MutS